MTAEPRFETQPGDEVWDLVDPGCTGQIGSWVLQCERHLESLAHGQAPPDLRLPEQHDGVESLEVDAVGFGFRIGECGPRLAKEGAAPLSVRVSKPQCVAVAGEISFDERPHVTHPCGRSQVEVEAARARDDVYTPAARGFRAAGNRDGRCLETIIDVPGTLNAPGNSSAVTMSGGVSGARRCD